MQRSMCEPGVGLLSLSWKSIDRGRAAKTAAADWVDIMRGHGYMPDGRDSLARAAAAFSRILQPFEMVSCGLVSLAVY